jgi:hypothetical protein
VDAGLGWLQQQTRIPQRSATADDVSPLPGVLPPVTPASPERAPGGAPTALSPAAGRSSSPVRTPQRVAPSSPAAPLISSPSTRLGPVGLATPGTELASAGLADIAPQPKRACGNLQQPLWVQDDAQSISSFGSDCRLSDLTGNGAPQQVVISRESASAMAAVSAAGQQMVLQTSGVPSRSDFQSNLANAAALQIQQNNAQNDFLMQNLAQQVFRSPGTLHGGTIPGQTLQQDLANTWTMPGQPAELDIQYLAPRAAPQRSNRAMGPYGRM